MRSLVALAAFGGVLASPAMAQSYPEPGSTSEYLRGTAFQTQNWSKFYVEEDPQPGGVWDQFKGYMTAACDRNDAAACAEIAKSTRISQLMQGTPGSIAARYGNRAATIYGVRCKAATDPDGKDCKGLYDLVHDLTKSYRKVSGANAFPDLDGFAVRAATPLIDHCSAGRQGFCWYAHHAFEYASPAAQRAKDERLCQGGDTGICAGLGIRTPKMLAELATYEGDCNRGKAASCTELSRSYYRQIKSFPGDAAKAVAFGRKACAGNDYAGCSLLGVILVDSNPALLPLRNLPEAADSFGRACKSGGENAAGACFHEKRIRDYLAQQATKPKP